MTVPCALFRVRVPEPTLSRVVVLCLAMMLGVGTPPAAGQAGTDPTPRRLELAVGGGYFGGAAIGEDDASLRANSLERQPYRLFSADTRLEAAPVLQARAGFALTPRYIIEGTFTFSRPELRTSVASDAEGAPALTVVEQVDQYLVDAGVVVILHELRIGPLAPYAAAGAGYLRQLHEGLTLIEEGHFYHLGGGVRHLLFSRASGIAKAVGVRADARLYILDGGIAFGDSPRSHGAISGSFFVVF